MATGTLLGKWELDLLKALQQENAAWDSRKGCDSAFQFLWFVYATSALGSGLQSSTNFRFLGKNLFA